MKASKAERVAKKAARAAHAASLLTLNLPPFLDQNIESPSRCILATRLAFDILNHLNIASNPVPVSVRALNREMTQALLQNWTPEEARERGAYEVAIDTNPGGPGYAGMVRLRCPAVL